MIQVAFGKSHISYLRFSFENLFAIKLLLFGSGTRNPGPLKWDPRPGIQKVSSGTQDPGPLKRDVNQ